MTPNNMQPLLLLTDYCWDLPSYSGSAGSEAEGGNACRRAGGLTGSLPLASSDGGISPVYALLKTETLFHRYKVQLHSTSIGTCEWGQ